MPLRRVIYFLILICYHLVNFVQCNGYTKRNHVDDSTVQIDGSGYPGFNDFVDPFFQSKTKEKSCLSCISKHAESQKTDGKAQDLFGTSPSSSIRPLSALGPGGMSSQSDSLKLFCTRGRCGSFTFKDLHNSYSSLFFTEDRINKITKEFKSLQKDQFPARPAIPGRPGAGGSMGQSDNDGDQCCPTLTSHMNVTILRNTAGEEREIVNFIGGNPPLQQYIPIGKCQQSLRCNNCRIERRLHFLLVMDPISVQFPPVKFDMFYIDSYCSCKSG